MFQILSTYLKLFLEEAKWGEGDNKNSDDDDDHHHHYHDNRDDDGEKNNSDDDDGDDDDDNNDDDDNDDDDDRIFVFELFRILTWVIKMIPVMNLFVCARVGDGGEY